MSSNEVHSSRVGNDVNQALSQPKMISNDPVPRETKLTNQVVEPMSRGNDHDETVAARANKAPGKQAKTSTKAAKIGKVSKNSNTEDSMERVECCCACCACLCECLCYIPCKVLQLFLELLCLEACLEACDDC